MTKQQKSTKRNWAEKQIKALIELGDDPLDAERFVRLALARTPEGVSPDEYLPIMTQAAFWAAVTQQDIQDARADWYASDAIPPRYKRLLDAKESEGQS